MNDSSHPVQLHIALPEHSSRGLNLPWLGMFIKGIMLIPLVILLFFMGLGVYFVVMLLQIPMWAILFTGKYPQGLAAWLGGLVQLQARASAYMFGLTDAYPGFSLDMKLTGCRPEGGTPQSGPPQQQIVPATQPGQLRVPPT